MPRTRFWAKRWTNGLGRARSGRTRTVGTVYALNVDVDLPDQSESVIVSMDLVKQAIEKADHIGTMNKCLRREADGCAHYPHDLACLFLGKSGRVVVQHGIGPRGHEGSGIGPRGQGGRTGACVHVAVGGTRAAGIWGLRRSSAAYLGDGVPIVPLMPKRKFYCRRI